MYGIAVQVYFGHETEQLTEADIEAMKAEATKISIPFTYAETVSGTLPEGITKRTNTVMFESDNSLRTYFYFDDANLSRYTFRVNGEEVTPVKKSSGRYYIEQQNIASALLAKKYTFSVSDGKVTYTVTASALSYAYGRQENSTNPDMVNLAKLLYLYYQAADAYFE